MEKEKCKVQHRIYITSQNVQWYYFIGDVPQYSRSLSKKAEKSLKSYFFLKRSFTFIQVVLKLCHLYGKYIKLTWNYFNYLWYNYFTVWTTDITSFESFFNFSYNEPKSYLYCNHHDIDLYYCHVLLSTLHSHTIFNHSSHNYDVVYTAANFRAKKHFNRFREQTLKLNRSFPGSNETFSRRVLLSCNTCFFFTCQLCWWR